jgi:hypothetical protein
MPSYLSVARRHEKSSCTRLAIRGSQRRRVAV